MRKVKIKTIDVSVKEWFDRVNGNSYFGGIITVNFGLKDVRQYNIPFQYGYGNHYQDIAFKILCEKESLTIEDNDRNHNYYYANNIIARYNKIEKCLKREVIAFGQQVSE